MKKRHIFQKELVNQHYELPPIFSCLTQIEKERFYATKSGLFFHKGQHIFHEGNQPIGIFCVNTGKVKLEHTGDEGKMQILRMAKQGDIIGYRALFCNEKYNANAVAIEDSVVYFIPKETFINALESNCKLAVNVIQLLAKDLRLAEDHLTERAQKTVRERMANAILFLSETYGFEEDNVTINVALTREEIADLVGTATETTIRLLSELKHEMVIDLVGRKIIILNKAKLYKSANLSTVLNG